MRGNNFEHWVQVKLPLAILDEDGSKASGESDFDSEEHSIVVGLSVIDGVSSHFFSSSEVARGVPGRGSEQPSISCMPG